MRYGNIDHAMAVAVGKAQTNACAFYVFATAYGFALDTKPPPPGQNHYEVLAGGQVLTHQWENAATAMKGGTR
jgi:hypothetical protein